MMKGFPHLTMRFVGLVVALSAALLLPLSAQEVATGELFTVKAGSVEFLNYEGPHQKIESAGQIRGIGAAMAEGRSSSYLGKYRIISIVPSSPDVLGADIVEILDGALVDHIDNVRRILSGFVAAKYGYDQEKADTIALFTTYYNAVHRGDLEYVRSRYTEAVLSRLDEKKMGISTSYKEWPGNTQMLIPLSLDGTGSARISADTVGGDEVVQELRSDESKQGLDDRKSMVELREDQLEEDKAATAEERNQLEEDTVDLQQKQEAAEAQQEEIDRRQDEVASALEGAEPGSTKEAELKGQQEELAKQEEQVQAAKQELEEQQQALDKQEEQVAAKEKEQASREEAIGQERDRIAGDEQKTIAEEEAAARQRAAGATAPGFTFMHVREENGIILSSMVIYDSESGKERGRSAVNAIRGRKVYPVSGAYLAVVGMDAPPKAVKLMLLNSDDLSVSSESEQHLYGESWVLLDNQRAYVVASFDGIWKIAAFDSGNLSLLAQSDVEVDPNTVIQKTGKNIIVESRDGSLLKLDPEGLSVVQ
ncbi:P83/100 family protein [Sediminispirochaeta smaragdinae]|nr:P83/100 family protein [Sediminispirochaeta smaragdinae]